MASGRSGSADGRNTLKAHPTIGVCGLDCGLCPRYYTVGKSRCPGCGGAGFIEKHPSCSFITCCVRKRGLEVCGQCPEFPCPKFKSEEQYEGEESSSYPPGRKMLSNLRLVKERGIEEFLRRQRKRMGLLEIMIGRWDDGRSRSFFCRAAALLDPEDLRHSQEKAKAAVAGGSSDAAHRAEVLKGMLQELALAEGVDLTKRM